jgi:hypothetical protein
MGIRREDGATQPGIKWWKFTTRIPGIHTTFQLSELIQGGLLTTATGGVVAALCMKFFGVPFEIAWTVVIIQLVWVWLVPVVILGEPYAPGWITPALPLGMVFLSGFPVGPQAIQAAVAVCILVSGIFLFFAVTSLGAKFLQWIPTELKGGIIFGGAVSAFQSEFGRLKAMPYTLPVVWAVVCILMFSIWFTKARSHNKAFNFIASLAMLVGLAVAAVVGYFTGEISFAIKWGIQWPYFEEFFKAMSPFYVGWPDWSMYLKALPLALMVYIFVFGDIILANTILDGVAKIRTDEKIPYDTTKNHVVLFIRNIGHLLTGGPFIPLHGPIWTGVHVFLAERYKTGRKNMDSFFDGLTNWYLPAFVLCFLVPVVSFMKPLLPVALSITLILTGFACAYIAMAMTPNKPAAQGYVFFVGMVIAVFGPAWGLGIGIVLYLFLLIQHVPGINVQVPVESGPSDSGKKTT